MNAIQPPDFEAEEIAMPSVQHKKLSPEKKKLSNQ